MLAQELREKYLRFFESKGHKRLPSDSLVPNDPSLLFTSAGMVQFKPYFLGLSAPPHPRVTTVQKCLRTTDIESVGDHSHLTFFEMLGNFSFGDYFKREAILWAWEFLTEWLHISPDRLRITIYLDDDEAYEVWNREVGVPDRKIFRFGEKSNYWPANAISEGPNGPCGPCSEIFYDTRPDLPATPDGVWDDVRWLEIWNLVFMQYERHDGGRLTPLPRKNIDTGMGLERTAAILAGKASVFETDVFQPIMARIAELSGRAYRGGDAAEDVAFRLIADHIRATTMSIADGVLPSNEGRGYVIRRILRRAMLRGQNALGFDRPFLADVATAVIDTLGEVYPELRERRDYVLRTIRSEEERFRQTIQVGSQRLAEMLDSPEVQKSKVLSGEQAFMLYDTYGFPLELTQEVAADAGIEVDVAGFRRAMEEQRQRAREASGIATQLFAIAGDAATELQKTLPPTKFLGYWQHESEAKVLAIIRQGEPATFASEGEEVEILLDQTPFYAEAGGQVGDTGWIQGENFQFEVRDTQKVGDLYLHIGAVTRGRVEVDASVSARIDAQRRWHIMRNHTATHLLHAALRQVLGLHVHQAGSLVAPDRLRFDFTHTSAMTDEEIAEVERLVNERILEDKPVAVHWDVPLAEARARGAMALFGEKYGDTVRMIEVPGVSLELCGGTHLERTSQIGLFKIVSEGSVAAGVRRIEAVTGWGVYQVMRQQQELLEAAAARLKCAVSDVPLAIERLQAQRQELERQIQQLRAGAAARTMQFEPTEIAGLQVVTGRADGVDAQTLASLADQAAQKASVDVVVLAAATDGKALFVAKAKSPAVAKGVHAGNLVRELARISGGGGGGRPEFAQAGGRDASKIPHALQQLPRLLEQMVEK
ncbi:MAG: alanine--tRNA ligase [bacterium]|nr:alanine--tRNA ligase [bacterium]